MFGAVVIRSNGQVGESLYLLEVCSHSLFNPHRHTLTITCTQNSNPKGCFLTSFISGVVRSLQYICAVSHNALIESQLQWVVMALHVGVRRGVLYIQHELDWE